MLVMLVQNWNTSGSVLRTEGNILAQVDFTKDLNVDTESKKLILRMTDMDH